MSSIRIQVIVPVVILAARKCAVDPSPYVRKAAAHAIPKIFRMDDTRQDELIEIIERCSRQHAVRVVLRGGRVHGGVPK